MKERPPVAVFAYRRARGLEATLKSLSECRAFDQHQIHLFVDGPKEGASREQVDDVHRTARQFDWANLTIHISESNQGLRRAIMGGVSPLIDRFGSAIVVEDDLRLSPLALDYFSAGIEAFADQEQVQAICGYMYKLKPPIVGDRAFFLPFASSWGWATWKRAWDPFVAAEQDLGSQAGDASFIRAFDDQKIIAAGSMMKAQRRGLIDSWAILWNAHIAKRSGVCLFPAQTMVLNEGFASKSATHSSSLNPLNYLLAHMNQGRTLAESFEIPEWVDIDKGLQGRVAGSWEARLHRTSARLGYYRRLLQRRSVPR